MPSPTVASETARWNCAEAERAAVGEELELASSPRHRWFSVYVGETYMAVVHRVVETAGRAPVILKVDLWNELVGGWRDVCGALALPAGGRLVGMDRSLPVCLGARWRTPGLLALRGDIRALPLRGGAVDAVLDLSVLDHVDPGDVAGIIASYRRALRPNGTLALVFWQRNAAVRFRVWLKRMLGRAEKEDQRYFPRAAVRAIVDRHFSITHEFAGGILLVLPLRLTGASLAAFPEPVAGRLVGRLARFEAAGRLRRVLKHFAGLYGIVATAR
jgi:SAM-dependent methyltransferase